MQLNVVLILCFLINYQANTQRIDYAGLCAYSEVLSDRLSFRAQPASLSMVKTGGVSIQGEQKYLIPGLTEAGLSLLVPAIKGCFAWQSAASSVSGFRKWDSNLYYGRAVGSQFRLGLFSGFSRSGTPGYDQTSSFSGGVGMIARISSRVQAGFFARSQFQFNSTYRRRISNYLFGIGYDLSTLVHLAIHVIKEDDFPPGLELGIHYQLGKRIWCRAGIATSISGWWIGIGTILRQCRLDVVSNYHPQLGMSPALMISFPFKNKLLP